MYDGAVYLFQGRPHLCRKLSVSERMALVGEGAQRGRVEAEGF